MPSGASPRRGNLGKRRPQRKNPVRRFLGRGGLRPRSRLGRSRLRSALCLRAGRGRGGTTSRNGRRRRGRRGILRRRRSGGRRWRCLLFFPGGGGRHRRGRHLQGPRLRKRSKILLRFSYAYARGTPRAGGVVGFCRSGRRGAAYSFCGVIPTEGRNHCALLPGRNRRGKRGKLGFRATAYGSPYQPKNAGEKHGPKPRAHRTPSPKLLDRGRFFGGPIFGTTSKFPRASASGIVVFSRTL